ncbi:hypothetical protein [Luteimonas sp. TWI1416]|uniref:hypothetical protein n=1 Tax=unclassified Luteimonas TaxID=2629088 RepID=UPI003209688B
MLDVVALLESAGAGTAFDPVGPEVADAVLAFLADGTSVPAIVACMIMTPDDGQSEPPQDEPDQDDDGDRRDDDDPGERSA